jgi:HEAT repeat protein
VTDGTTKTAEPITAARLSVRRKRRNKLLLCLFWGAVLLIAPPGAYVWWVRFKVRHERPIAPTHLKIYLALPGFLAPERKKAIEVLCDQVEQAVPDVVALLRHKDRSTRETAFYALHNLIESKLPGIQALDGERYPSLVDKCPRLDRQLRDAGVIGGLEFILQNSDFFTRRKVVDTLGNLGGPEAARVLIWTFGDETYDHAWAAGRFEHIRDSVSIGMLKTALKSKNEETRAWAAIALGWTEEPGSLDALTANLKSASPDVRSWSVCVLGYSHNRKAVPVLLRMLESGDRDLRWSVASALGTLGDKRAVKPLISALEDPDRSVRSYAAGALGMIGDVRAVEALKKATKDEESSVSRAAESALKKIEAAIRKAPKEHK